MLKCYFQIKDSYKMITNHSHPYILQSWLPRWSCLFNLCFSIRIRLKHVRLYCSHGYQLHWLYFGSHYLAQQDPTYSASGWLHPAG